MSNINAQPGVRLSPFTTLGLGGPARSVVAAETEAELVEAVTQADFSGDPLLLLAGGSNVVIADVGFDGQVILVRTEGVHFTDEDGEYVRARVAAGQNLDEFVAECVTENLAGIECLSGIPGSVGATPMQNVGAYGCEIAETIHSVRLFDRTEREILEWSPAQCRFGYRDSALKRTDRYVVLSVTLSLKKSAVSAELRYGELAARLESSRPFPLADVREAVLGVRRGKGMVLDANDPDTRSVGSFFTNPIVSEEAGVTLRSRFREMSPPMWHIGNGTLKLSAAWLIEQAGFTRGYGRGGIRISHKHTLALTHDGSGSAEALLSLAREIAGEVYNQFGVVLVPEPRIVGDSW